ncbi:MAG: aminopeptidase P family protein [Proteobacteria bacterium]|nr:aminopeptidase P family protein [Pseudomonadota bacterium]
MLAPNPYFPPFSRKEFNRRYRVLRAEMKKKDLDCLVVWGAIPLGGNDTGQINAQYLSNFAAVGNSYVVLPKKEDPTLHLSLEFHIPNARDIGAIDDVRAGFRVELHVADRLKEIEIRKGGRVGIVGASFHHMMPCTLPYEHYTHLLETFPGVEFENVSEWYEGIRAIKSEEEIRLIERAATISDICHEAVVHATRPGVSHADVRRVAEEVSFVHKANYCMLHMSSFSMENQTFIYPDFWPTDKTFKAGDLVMTEVPIGYGMYYTKIMGTYFVGEPTKEYRDMFELAAKVHDSVIENLKPGMTGGDVDQFALPIKEAGYTSAGLVSGWSNYNSLPFVGQTEPDFPQAQTRNHLDFEFKPGFCAQVMAYPISPEFHALWIGSTSVMTPDGLRRLNAYPVNEIRVA